MGLYLAIEKHIIYIINFNHLVMHNFEVHQYMHSLVTSFFFHLYVYCDVESVVTFFCVLTLVFDL